MLVHEGQAVSGHYWAYLCYTGQGGDLDFTSSATGEGANSSSVAVASGSEESTSLYSAPMDIESSAPTPMDTADPTVLTTEHK